jgi:hypothetical protein
MSTDVSKLRTAAIIRALMETVRSGYNIQYVAVSPLALNLAFILTEARVL